MVSPFDGSPLKEIGTGIFQDNSNGYLLTNPAAVRQQYENHGETLATQEIKLDNLGVFPLAKASLPLLNRELQFNGQILRVVPLLRQSQIPIFSSSDAQVIYIPPEGAAICRYFHELWRSDHAEEQDPVLSGFAVIASYAGF